MTWGWNPDTIAACATGAATVFAALAALLAVLDVRSRRILGRRAQADLVAAWTMLEEVEEHEYPGMHIYECVLRVANRSDLPVINLHVTSMPSNTSGEPLDPAVRRWHSLGPGQVDRVHLGRTDGHDALGYPGRVLAVEFTDHAGRRWTRDEQNGLQEGRGPAR